MTPAQYKASKDRVAQAIKDCSAKEANEVFWQEVAGMSDVQAVAMMEMIGMEITQ